MINWVSNFRAAFSSLREQRGRAWLSALGVTVAATAIVLLISIAKGVQSDVTKQVDGLGVNLLIVLPFRVQEGSMFMPNAAGMSYLSDDDVARVRTVSGVKRAAPLTFVGGGIRYGNNESPQTLVLAAGHDWFAIRPVKYAEGGPFTKTNEMQNVCVIGDLARQNLFGKKSAINKEVDVNGIKFRVVGVTEKKRDDDSMISMGSFDNVVYLPYGWFRRNTPDGQLHRIMIQTSADVEPATLVSNVESAMQERLNRQLFSVVTQIDLLKLVFKLMGILTWLLTGLTSIALFVGGVGIMAVMLMSVGERVKEIGIRKAVGAKQRDLFNQFLAEAVLVSMLGGLVGLIISYAACLALYYFTPIKPQITGSTIALCFGVSIGVGGVFGLIPALNAARKDAVVSLRNE